MSLRYAYVSSGLADHRLDDALELLADSGYAGVSLTLDHIHFDPFAPRLHARAVALRERLEGLGLACTVETGGRFVLDPRRKHFPTLLSDGRERRIELLCRAVEVAAELAAPVVSMWSGALPDGLDPERAWELLVDGCDRVVDHAQRHDVTIAFEPEPGMLVEALADYDELERRLGRPAALALTLDIGHCVCLEPLPVADCVRHAGSRLAHVHMDDMRRGVHEHLMFGDGELDVETTLAALEEVAFTGLVAVELTHHAHAAHEVVPRAIARLQEGERATVRM